MPVEAHRPCLLASRDGAVALMFGLMAPLLLLTVAFGIDVTCLYRDALHLQGVADRAAASAGPLWLVGDRRAARQVATALTGDVRLDRLAAVTHGGGLAAVSHGDVVAAVSHGDVVAAVSHGKGVASLAAVEVIVSCPKRHLLANLWAPGRLTARAVAIGPRLVE